MKKSVTLICTLLLALTGFAQNGALIKMKLSSDKTNISGNMLVYHSAVGSRSEMTMQMAQLPTGMSFVSMMKYSEPDKVILLNEKNKTYSESRIGDVTDNNEYTVTILGTESVKGYACTHALVTDKTGMSTEVWNTKDIADYSAYKKIYNSNPQAGSYKRDKALEDAGVDGFPVKTKMKTREGEMTMELESIEKKELAANLFEIPSDYTKTDNPAGAILPSATDIQKMSPEQRTKLKENMKKQYGIGH
jgi:hypothetical protein